MKKATDNLFPQTLMEAIVYFADADIALNTIARMRWPDGVTCPACQSRNVGFLAKRRVWSCKDCRKQFSVKTGSIMEDSPIGLDKWLCAIWMIANCKNGVSSYEIKRDLRITQKSAWFLMHRVRAAMTSGSFEKLRGKIEIDESYFGGEARFMHKNVRARKITGTGGVNKLAVMGIGRRNEDGKGLAEVRAQVVPSVAGATLIPIIRKNVGQRSDPGGRTKIFTDCHDGYNALDGQYSHYRINHSTEYVRGDVTTNRIENYWSVLKRGLKGTYIRANGQHLDRYIGEASFRYNNRKVTDAERFQKVLQSIGGKRLTYDDLTGKE